MEVKINKEIMDYTEAIYFGLSMKQCIFSALACLSAVGVYFCFKGILGTETVSWLCVITAAPFAFFGFFKYNGMTAKQFLIAYVKSEFLIPRRLLFHAHNKRYEEMFTKQERKKTHAKKSIPAR